MVSVKLDGTRSAVVIMVAAARPGQVKTRRYRPLSKAEAAELRRCFPLDKIAQVNALQKAASALSYGPAGPKALSKTLHLAMLCSSPNSERTSETGCSRPSTSSFGKAIGR